MQTIAAGLDKVFEIGPVFRAENSNTRRHFCEFTGLDLEKAIAEHYEETLHVIHRILDSEGILGAAASPSSTQVQLCIAQAWDIHREHSRRGAHGDYQALRRQSAQ